MATKIDIPVDQSSDITYQFQAFDENNLPLDITGANIVLTGRFSITSPDAILSLSTGAGNIAIADGPHGVWNVTFPATMTANLPEMLVYDQYIYLTTGPQYRASQGYIFIDPSVT